MRIESTVSKVGRAAAGGRARTRPSCLALGRRMVVAARRARAAAGCACPSPFRSRPARLRTAPLRRAAGGQADGHRRRQPQLWRGRCRAGHPHQGPGALARCFVCVGGGLLLGARCWHERLQTVEAVAAVEPGAPPAPSCPRVPVMGLPRPKGSAARGGPRTACVRRSRPAAASHWTTLAPPPSSLQVPHSDLTALWQWTLDQRRGGGGSGAGGGGVGSGSGSSGGRPPLRAWTPHPPSPPAAPPLERLLQDALQVRRPHEQVRVLVVLLHDLHNAAVVEHAPGVGVAGGGWGGGGGKGLWQRARPGSRGARRGRPGTVATASWPLPHSPHGGEG
jgi:hypothetical protein